jgi:hypothetical protein
MRKQQCSGSMEVSVEDVSHSISREGVRLFEAERSKGQQSHTTLPSPYS